MSQNRQEFLQEEQVAYASILPPTPQELQEMEAVLPQTPVMQARVEIARLVQEGQSSELGLIAGLWLVATPFLGIWTLVELLNGSIQSFLAGLLFLSAIKISKTTLQNDQLRGAISLRGTNGAWIGPLAEILEWPVPRAKNIAKYALTYLLPSINPTDWADLTPQQRQIFYAHLDPKYTRTEATFQTALLDGIRRAGDTNAIAQVERLATLKHWFSPKRRCLIERAIECLTHLERIEQEEIMRASNMAWSESALEVEAPAVQEKTPPELQALITEIREAREKSSQPGMRLPYLIASWFIIVPFCAVLTFVQLSEGSKLLAALWACLAVAGTQLYRLTLLPWQTASARRLAEYDSVKGVGLMVEVLEWPDPASKLAASSALIRLLPRLKTSDAHLLNPDQRQILYKRLTLGNVRAEYELIMATLKALEQVGDVSAVGYVQKLSQARATTSAQVRVVQAAQDCLPYLLKRAESNQSSQYLLRASYSEEHNPATLLRPARDDSVAPEELLRPQEGLD
jgi:hypothetical protein